MLDPNDIIRYSLITTETICQCGNNRFSGRPWVTYAAGNQRAEITVPMLDNEPLYTRKPILHKTETFHIPVCEACAELRVKTDWTPSKAQAANAHRSNVLSPTHIPDPNRGYYSDHVTIRPAKPATPKAKKPEESLESILGKISS